MARAAVEPTVVRRQVSPGFEGLREAFADNFVHRHELGGACCTYAYVMSRTGTALTGDPRAVALRDALYRAIAE